MMPAALNAVNGSPYAIDIGHFCEDRYFVYVAGFGAFTEVSYLTPQDKKNLLGHQAYILEGVKSLASIKSYSMKISCPEETLEGEFIYGMVTNTVSVGGFKGLVNQNVALKEQDCLCASHPHAQNTAGAQRYCDRTFDEGRGKQRSGL